MFVIVNKKINTHELELYSLRVFIMEDLTSILERARMLTSAANQVAEQMTQQAEEYSAVIQARRADENIQLQLKKNQNKSKSIAKNDVGTQKVVSENLYFMFLFLMI